MNTQLDKKSQSAGGRNSSSARALAVSEKHSLALLGFFTLSGLLYVTAAVFTTMLTSGVLRDPFLVITITVFVGMLVGVTLFALSYQSHQGAARIADSQ
jgi:hypothetical protein